jgi:outer membrane immunogenic protein
MQKQLTAGLIAAVLGFGGAAHAADMYAPSGAKDIPYGPNWTGLYVGFNAGYGTSTGSDQLAEVGYSAGLRAEGGFGGVQIGYNWQGSFVRPGFVFGIEADFQESAINDRNVLVYADSNEEYTSRLDWFGTVRGRLGYTVGNGLIYATGGLAYGGLHKSFQYDDESYNYDKTTTGYAVGAGLEYKLTPSWSVKAEYLYLNFGKNDLCGSDGCYADTGYRIVRDDDYHTLRLGMNYSLNWYEPLK